MGLDIHAISGIVTKVTDPIAYEFNELLMAEPDEFYVNADFPEHAAEFGIKSGPVEYIKTDESKEHDFNVGSYSTYNKLRNILCLAIHGTEVEKVWDNYSKFNKKALWELLNFSDCEGTIDSVVSTKILKDLNDNKTKFSKYIKDSTDIGDMDTEHYISTYDSLIKCFTLGADGGIVIFG